MKIPVVSQSPSSMCADDIVKKRHINLRWASNGSPSVSKDKVTKTLCSIGVRVTLPKRLRWSRNKLSVRVAEVTGDIRQAKAHLLHTL